MTAPLIAVVGPSGAGKDSVIDAARRRLDGDPRFAFPRRVVTRPAGAGFEDHVAAAPAEFAALDAAGAFVFAWEAHGIRYGIPAAIADDLAAGRSVVVNLSREAVVAARARFPTVVVEITAPVPVLAERLARRGRETAAEIRERLSRAEAVPVDADRVVVNDGPLERAVDAFAAILAEVRP